MKLDLQHTKIKKSIDKLVLFICKDDETIHNIRRQSKKNRPTAYSILLNGLFVDVKTDVLAFYYDVSIQLLQLVDQFFYGDIIQVQGGSSMTVLKGS